MNKKISLFIGFILSLQVCAQTGIGTTMPNASAKLDVFSDNKGFLPPRVSLSSATDNTTVPSPAEGLLIYNKGTVGLQAGYYYWNGANWATIATATSAGNGVASMDMVKLYSEEYSSLTGKIAHANGYSFTVPVSGRYLFDFSCSAFTSNTTFTMFFKVRQGTTDLSTDAQTSSNNSAHVEYNGKLEVNLQAGTTYNVYVTGGSRNNNDYDRVYMKMVAGNLPLNQHIAERNIQLNNNFLSNDGDNEGIRIDNSGNVGIGTNSPNASAILDLSSTTKGVLIPRMTASQRAAISNPEAGLIVYQTNANSGNYFFNGSSWDVLSNANYGDIKTGIQSSDHNGWIRLNGRLKSSLTSTQQTQATALGIGANLPNADNTFLVQNGGTLGAISGSNSKIITQANLPNVTLTGNSSTDAGHTHTIPFTTNINASWNIGGGAAGFNIVGTTTTSSSGSHAHTISTSSINGGVTQTQLDITPRSLSVNTFIYLGY
jgi:hypothetical protein